MDKAIAELLDLTIKNKASDLHLLVGTRPSLRVDGQLNYLTGYPLLTNSQVEQMVFSVLKPEQKQLFLTNKELDFSFGYGPGAEAAKGRFRTNIYFQKGYISASFRYLLPTIRGIDELMLPQSLHEFSKLKQGFILVTGPTGHGKSTTLAAIINEINLTRAVHILTIEDPIEYIYPVGKSLISQREMETDTLSWPHALSSALREDPDVVLIGEMRDPETISAALTIAETGHLVFSTLHTNSASQTVSRIIDSFPAAQQPQIRMQLSETLRGVVSQRLIPRVEGGRAPAVELLLGTPAIETNIREGKDQMIDSIIATSQELGMITLESSLAGLVKNGVVSADIARAYSQRPEEFDRQTTYR